MTRSHDSDPLPHSELAEKIKVLPRTPLEYALAEIGVLELTGNNDGIPSTRYQGGRREAYCAHFVAWCCRMAGHPIPGDRVPHAGMGGENPIASVEELEKQLRLAGKFLPSTALPEPGDVILFRDRGDSDPAKSHAVPRRHCGIVELGDPIARRVYTIEANVLDRSDPYRKRQGVFQREYPLDHPRISGYGRL